MNKSEALKYSSPMIYTTYTLQNDSEVALDILPFGRTEYVRSKVWWFTFSTSVLKMFAWVV
jgi:hypothetical protein